MADRNTRRKKQKRYRATTMAVLSLHLSVIILNINGVDSPKDRVVGWIIKRTETGLARRVSRHWKSMAWALFRKWREGNSWWGQDEGLMGVKGEMRKMCISTAGSAFWLNLLKRETPSFENACEEHWRICLLRWSAGCSANDHHLHWSQRWTCS